MTRAIRRRWWHGVSLVLIVASTASSHLARVTMHLQIRAFARFIRAGG